MLFAAVTPLSLAGKLIGSLLGVAVVSVGVFLFGRSRSHGSDDGGEADFATQIHRDAQWRRPNAVLIVLIGVAFLVGVWVNPVDYPILFIGVWMGILLATMATVVVAVYDILFVRKRAIQDKMQLLEQNRSDLERDLKEYFRSRSHKGNGLPPSGNRL